MTLPRKEDRLLEDVFSEGLDRGLRARLLEDTLKCAGARRSLRTARNLAGALVLVCICGLWTWWAGSGARHDSPRPFTGYTVVRTQPLPRGAIVATRALGAGGRIASYHAAPVIRSSPGGALTIGDDELLALVAPRPVLLVRRGPHSAELVFATEADQRTFLMN